MKEIRMILLLVAMVGVIDSCTKTETKTVTSAATTNGIFLAGAAGQSKSWTLASITQSKNGGTAVAGTGIPTCESDNIFKFSNSSLQSYQSSEGNSTCTSTDPATIESGNWAFTDDGKTLLIEGTINVTSDEVFGTDHDIMYFLLFTYFGPLNVVKISDTSLTLTYTYTSGTDTYLMTIVLQKV
ncbi:MAG TPA: hypothetical protein VGQ59_21900 [Cyclobacteriaceae bacterium]|nr:hypothetical protein [Cyclobacteriaceae bacterium]